MSANLTTEFYLPTEIKLRSEFFKWEEPSNRENAITITANNDIQSYDLTIPSALSVGALLVDASGNLTWGDIEYTDKSLTITMNSSDLTNHHIYLIQESTGDSTIKFTTPDDTYTMGIDNNTNLFKISHSDQLGVDDVFIAGSSVVLNNLILPEMVKTGINGRITIGTTTLYNIESDANMFYGVDAGNLTYTTANNNIAFGNDTLSGLIGGTYNIAIGHSALTSNDGTNNTGLGYGAGTTSTGDNNTFVGFNADTSIAGLNNVCAIGSNASVDKANKIQLGDASTAYLGIASTELTIDELNQVANIGATTITAANWSYVSTLDQDLTTTADVKFANIEITGDTKINGDLFVYGTETILDVENVEVKDNIILLNRDESGAGVTAGTAGIRIDRGTADDYNILFDETSGAVIMGEVGSEQPAALREYTPTGGAIPVWSSLNEIYTTADGLSAWIATQLKNIGSYTLGANQWGLLEVAGLQTTGNITIGSSARNSATGIGNIAIGTSALNSDVSASNYNIAIGESTLGVLNNLTAIRNIAIGYSAGDELTTGYNNILIGSETGAGLTSGLGNIAIGDLASVGNGSNRVVIGAGASAGVDNSIVLGGASALVGIRNSSPTEALDINGNGLLSGSLKVDTILEYTTDNGVDIESVHCEDGNITATEIIANTLSNMEMTGFIEWDGGAPYWSFVGGTGIFTLEQSGSGYIKSELISFTASQNIACIMNQVNYIYIDSSGVIRRTASPDYVNTIMLFELLYEAAGTYTIKKENHPYNFQTRISTFFHNNLGTIIQGEGCNLAVGTNTRQIQIIGEAIIQDHGLSTTISALNPATIAYIYKASSGFWSQATYDSNTPILYNNGGSTATITSGRYGIFRVYAGLDDLNTSTPKFFAILGNSIYSTLSLAITAISNGGAFDAADNEFSSIEPCQIGYFINRNVGGISIVQRVIIEKNTFNARYIGGSTGTSHLLLSDLDGGQYLTGGHQYLAQRHEATTNPVGTDDTDNYRIGALWINTTSDQAFICVDNTDSAAIWRYVGSNQALLTTSSPTFASPLITGTLSADTILEYTTDNGVDIEGVHCEDGAISLTDISDITKNYNNYFVIDINGGRTDSFYDYGGLQIIKSTTAGDTGGIGINFAYNHSSSPLTYWMGIVKNDIFSYPGNFIIGHSGSYIADLTGQNVQSLYSTKDFAIGNNGNAVFYHNVYVQTGGILYVNTINERTGGNGVDIESVHCEDGSITFTGTLNTITPGEFAYLDGLNQYLTTTSSPTFASPLITGTLSADTITEYTTDNGVDIEGVHCEDGNITATEIIADTLSNMEMSGFLEWGGSGVYWSMTGSTFTIERPGSGYIKSVKVSWLGSQSITIPSHSATCAMINTSGSLVGVDCCSVDYYNYIALFEVFYNGTNYIVKNETHPYNFQTTISQFFHNNLGSIIRGEGAIIGIGSAADTIKISGDDYLEDHGLISSITSADPIELSWIYINGGQWYIYAATPSGSIIQYVWNNAGTPTAGDSGKYLVFRIYVHEGDLNSGAIKYLSVIHTEQFANQSAAETAIRNGTIQQATNEVFIGLEPCMLGYIICKVGTGIENVIIEKNTFNARYIGGSTGTSHLLLSDLDGGQYLTGGHQYLAQRHEATTNPAGTDDTDNYRIGALWINTTSDQAFICVDNTDSAAIWRYVGSNQALLTTSSPTFASPLITGTLSADTITEYTTDNGVDIEGVHCEDGSITFTGTLNTITPGEFAYLDGLNQYLAKSSNVEFEKITTQEGTTSMVVYDYTAYNTSLRTYGNYDGNGNGSMGGLIIHAGGNDSYDTNLLICGCIKSGFFFGERFRINYKGDIYSYYNDERKDGELVFSVVGGITTIDSLKTDTINEDTANNGVGIESTLIKDAMIYQTASVTNKSATSVALSATELVGGLILFDYDSNDIDVTFPTAASIVSAAAATDNLIFHCTLATSSSSGTYSVNVGTPHGTGTAVLSNDFIIGVATTTYASKIITIHITNSASGSEAVSIYI